MSKSKDELLNLALKTAGVAYWEWNPKENTLNFDKEWFQQIEVLGDDTRLESWMKALHPEDQELVSFKIKEHLEGRSDFYEVVMRLKTKKGYYRHVLAKGKIVERNTLGEPTKFSGVHLDLTEMISLKKVNEEQKKEIENNSKMIALGEMSSGIAHEINNPLAIIMGNVSLIDKPNLTEKQQKSLASINSAVERIAKIIRGLRDFSSKENNKHENNDVIKILEDVVLSKINNFKINNVDFSIENQMPLESAALVLGNTPDYLKVFNNLISNAFDAALDHEDKWVKVIVKPQDSYVKILIVDSGKGISPSIETKIFHPFFTTKEVGKGTGLGLSVAKGLVESFGGHLNYQLKDGHTAFELLLPRYYKESK